MNAKELCDLYVVWKWPALSPELQAEMSKVLLDISEPWHLADMRLQLIAAAELPEDPIPDSPAFGQQCIVRRDGRLTRLTWDGNNWREQQLPMVLVVE